MNRKKILIIIGTRPEAIKMAPVWFELSKLKYFEVRSLDSGQHQNLMKPTLEVFGWVPDYSLKLELSSSSLSRLLINLQKNIDQIISEWRPDLILTHGDTATTLAASLVAAMHKVPLGHVEAGLRSRNKMEPWPEEINRILTDVLADYHFCPTESAKNNLLREGYDDRSILVTGNTVVDSLNIIVEKLKDERVRRALRQSFSFLNTDKKIILITGHRRENVGDNFKQLAESLLELSKGLDCRLVVVTHPNGHLKTHLDNILKGNIKISIIDPPNYLEFVFLMINANLIITDSGGIQEEAPTLNKKVIVTRKLTEREEGLHTGHLYLTGCDKNLIFARAKEILNEKSVNSSTNPYGDGNAAKKIAHFLKENL